MPTYDYQCSACDHRFDEMQAFSDPPLTKCPACGKKKLRRLFGTGAAVLFKGSGFYETDYRSESYKTGQKADADAAKPAETKSGDGKAESKPAEAAPAARPGKSGKAKVAAKDD